MKKNNFLRNAKRLTAGLLTAAMVLTGAPFGNFTARAATELEPNVALNTQGDGPRGVSVNPNGKGYSFGSSATTAYAFGKTDTPILVEIPPEYGGGFASELMHGGTNYDYGTEGGEDPFTFNIAAITDENYRANWSRGYYSDNSSTTTEAKETTLFPTLKSAFQRAWWHGYYAFAKPYRIGSNVLSTNATAGSDNYASGTGADTADPVITTWGGDYGAQPTAATFYGTTTKKALHKGLTTYKNGEVFTITNPSGGNVEVRQEVMPSPDDQYIYVKYTVYNNSASQTDFMIGNESDTMLGAHDDVPIFVTKHDNTNDIEGLHFHNKDHSGSNSSHAVFDIISKGKGIGGQDVGMQRRDSSDKSENRVWAGSWSKVAGIWHTDWVFSQSRPGYVGAGQDSTSTTTGDTAAAFSAYFDLQPYETKTTAFALAIKPYVIYVDPVNGKDDSSGTGFMGSPVKSIKKALEILSLKPYDIKKAYIYIQGNIDNQNETIVIPANRDITIQTTDYKPLANAATINFNKVPLYTDDAPIPETSTFTIKRDTNFTGPLFEVKNPTSTLNFSNITIDGNGANVTAAAPIVELSAGNVKLKDNTTIQNSNVAKGLNNGISPVSETTPKASAIDVDGAGVLTMESNVKPIYIKNNIGNSRGNDPKIPAINVSSTVNRTFAADTGIGEVRARAVNVSGNVNVDNNDDIHTVVDEYYVDATGALTPVSSVPTGATVTTTLVAPTATEPNPKTTTTEKTSTTITKEEHNDSSTNPATVYRTVTTVTTSKANVNLDKSMLYVGKGKTFTGTIGVTISDVPNTSDDNDGRPVIDYEGRSTSSVIPYSVGNIKTDRDGVNPRMGMITAKATDVNGAVLTMPQSEGIVYLKTQKYNFTVTYIDPDGNTIPIPSLVAGTNTIPGALDPTNTSSYAFRAAPGSEVNIPMPSYIFNGIPTVFDSATGASGTLTVVNTDPVAPATTPTKGTVMGTTPNIPLDIVISLKKNVMTYKFDSNGGIAVSDVIAPVGVLPSTMPSPTKTGYTFAGWLQYTDANNNDSYDVGETIGTNTLTSYPASSTADTLHFYATWTPDGTRYPISTYHKNINPGLPLTFGSEVDPGYVIESIVDKDHITVPGYIYDSGSATPVSAGQIEPNPSVTAGVAEGHYHISSMPASAVTLNYKYRVDPNATFTFTVRHVDALGNIIPGTTVHTSQRRAEQSINAMADNSIAGYTYATYRITAGENDDAAGSYILGLNHQETVGGITTTPYIVTNDTTTGTFIAHMPNQDVSIDYVYAPNAGMNLVRRYYDRFTDSIIASQVEASMPLANVSASIPAAGSTVGDKLYGYSWDASSMVYILDISNLTGPVSVNHNPLNGDLNGTMPASGNGVRAD
ncbi:repeat, TIGR02543 family, partial [Lachnoanaerobaculum sp. ICM7]|uniref:InlB B-repeat-containing protein n=1 Tax=Lachnoanaerobaculum sp. ICM7 TaxID=936594 RepID=UPI00027A4502